MQLVYIIMTLQYMGMTSDVTYKHSVSITSVNTKSSMHANNCCKIIPCTLNDRRKGTDTRRSFHPVIQCARNYLTYNNYSHELKILRLS